MKNRLTHKEYKEAKSDVEHVIEYEDKNGKKFEIIVKTQVGKLLKEIGKVLLDIKIHQPEAKVTKGDIIFTTKQY